MRVQKIQSQTQNRPLFKGVTIPREANKSVKYLDNKILDMITLDRLTGKGGFGGTFDSAKITLATEKKSVLDKLTELGIKWIKDKK